MPFIFSSRFPQHLRFYSQLSLPQYYQAQKGVYFRPGSELLLSILILFVPMFRVSLSASITRSRFFANLLIGFFVHIAGCICTFVNFGRCWRSISHSATWGLFYPVHKTTAYTNNRLIATASNQNLAQQRCQSQGKQSPLDLMY